MGGWARVFSDPTRRLNLRHSRFILATFRFTLPTPDFTLSGVCQRGVLTFRHLATF